MLQRNKHSRSTQNRRLEFHRFMDINQVELSSELLAALYPDSLVLEGETGKTEPGKARKKQYPGKKPASQTGGAAPGQSAEAYHFLGNNLRRVCFIVSYPEAVFLPDDQLDFLSKMLLACGCSIADISVLNAGHSPIDINKLITQLNPEKLFLCGITPASLNLPVPMELFQISGFQGISTILIPSLTTLSQKEAAGLVPIKKKLWASLKTLFNIPG